MTSGGGRNEESGVEQRRTGTAARRPAPPRSGPGGGARPPVRSARPGSSSFYPARTAPKRIPRPPKRWIGAEFGRRHGLRTGIATLSAVVLLATGIGHGLFKDLVNGLVRSNVIAGGSNGGPQNILLVGVDSRTDAQGQPLPREALAELRAGAADVLNSDTIILLHVPADGGRAVGISIPRDSYVDIPGYRRDKINAAYPATKTLKAESMVEQGITDRRRIELESSTDGRTTLVKTVEKLTGVKVDHYAEVNLLGFSNLTKAIGGVDVCLNGPVSEPLSGANFPAGRQTISGGAALAFVRQRYGLAEGDLSRIRRQQVFMAAVAHKILTAGTLTNPAKLQELVDVAKQAVVIDSDWDVFGFAQQASSLAAGAIEFVTIPTAGNESNSRGDVLLVDRDAVQRFVQDHTGTREETTTQTQADGVIAPSSMIVDVRNSSGATGLAAEVSGQLTTVGYGKGDQDNAGRRTTSVVRYSGSDDRAARQVAAVLGGMPIEQDTTVAGGHVRVYLGTDYQRGTVLAPGQSSPAPAPSAAGTPAPITAGGVPCVD
ncbi:MAG: cell envelope-related transcriptional attenuator [Pseudonocardia sp.]|nr:cell envelope-related transcriptional attenuator [Pseudonocardia sp.]